MRWNLMDEEKLYLQPYLVQNGQMILGPELPTDPHQYIGFLIDTKSRSLIVMLYDQSMLDTSQPDKVIPCVVLEEKDVARAIGGFQQALRHLRSLPVPPVE